MKNKSLLCISLDGQGLVAHIAALSLIQQGFQLYWPHTLAANGDGVGSARGSRCFALTPHSWQLLRTVLGDVLEALPHIPVRHMSIAVNGNPLHFDALLSGVPALAYMIEEAVLRQALQQAIFPTLRSGQIQAQAGEMSPVLHLHTSKVAHMTYQQHDYQQTAISLALRSQKPHQYCARQFMFTAQGQDEQNTLPAAMPCVVALLPRPEGGAQDDGHGLSLVWSMPNTLLSHLDLTSAEEVLACLVRRVPEIAMLYGTLSAQGTATLFP